jgi:hypothetical protein
MYQFSTKPGCKTGYFFNVNTVLTTEPRVSKHSLTYLKTYFRKKVSVSFRAQKGGRMQCVHYLRSEHGSFRGSFISYEPCFCRDFIVRISAAGQVRTSVIS